ncbi:RNA methyltransferase [Chlorobaculum sp. MV4-Y]|uniref:TrmH family RNA methyltransferase n=1 Tax=Chlorobaculum sp. MV4-Y TaxID=2976335 RepID=UPI0021AF1B7E|nr:RNA methyltransferase [Chlorobaculum sp. MV4-Y]UWX57295.1 RNA methyltransferase [Chlorobaculum sp. MV4-Y]
MRREPFPPLSKAMLGRLARLGQKKHRDSESLFLAEGLRTVSELLQSLPDPAMLHALVLDENAAAQLDGLRRFAGKVWLAGTDDFRRLAQTTSPQGVCAAFRKPQGGEYRPASARSFVVALDDVQDPGNVGTIIRTAAWFGAEAVICGRGTADPFNAKSVRSSAGSIFALGIDTTPDLAKTLRRLQTDGFTVAASALNGQDYRSFAVWPDRRILVIGNEANGISTEVLALANRRLLIPHAGAHPAVESLNASVSAGILMATING